MSTPANRTRQLAPLFQWAQIALFGALLLAPALDPLLELDPTPARRELRRPAPFPTAADAALPAALRSWVGDHFGFRDALIRLHALLSVRVLGVSSTDTVVLGRDGWAYLAAEGALESYRAANPFAVAELDHLAFVFETRRRWLEERDIEYVVAVAPNKHTIYPEKLPAAITRVGDATRLDQLQRVLAAETDVVAVDLRPVLAEQARTRRVYDPLGTHWNGLGAYLAYRALMDRASQRVPGIQTLPLRAFEVREEIGGDVALARLLGLEGSLQAPTLRLEPRTAARARSLPRAAAPYCDLLTLVPGREAPRLVVIQDSFGIELQPFLSETFARACFLGSEWIKVLERQREAIALERPDLVIQLFAERRLERSPTSVPPWGEPR